MEFVKKWTGGKEGKGNYYFEISDANLNKVDNEITVLYRLADKSWEDLRIVISNLNDELTELNDKIDEIEVQEWAQADKDGHPDILRPSNELHSLYQQQEELETKINTAEEALEKVRSICMHFSDN